MEPVTAAMRQEAGEHPGQVSNTETMQTGVYTHTYSGQFRATN